jgi:hypothetical protein
MSCVPHNSHVEKGQKLGQIVDACIGDVRETLVSPVDGTIFFQHNEPIIYAHSSALKILADEES